MYYKVPCNFRGSRVKYFKSFEVRQTHTHTHTHTHTQTHTHTNTHTHTHTHTHADSMIILYAIISSLKKGLQAKIQNKINI
jgi:hypothetical protein